MLNIRMQWMYNTIPIFGYFYGKFTYAITGTDWERN